MVTGKSLLLNKLSTTSWMVRPEFLVTMQNILQLKFVDNLNLKELFGVEIDPEAVASKYADIPINRSGSKLLIEIEGTLIPKGSWMDTFCGFVGMQQLSSILKDAKEDSYIDHVILSWDCPGGSAQGTPELAKTVKELSNSKRVTSLVTGNMCSAAYFIGSAADEIYSTSLINDVGSIGVVALHVDQSEYDKSKGLKYTYLSAGKYKTMGNPHESLNPESFGELMSGINYSYEIFKKAVQEYRGFTDEEIEQVAEGRVFAAGQAIQNKLIDGVASLEEILTW